jgi:hypothetical protein
MSKGRVSVARRFMETYDRGAAEGLLACLTDEWVLHEEDGSITSRSDLADITRSHADAFPEKRIEWLSEVADDNGIAQHVRFTLVHSGVYHDLDRPAGRLSCGK